jgi:hypothetical protein
LHPEVKYVGFLTSPFAGTSLLNGFKYSPLNNIQKVKKLKLKRKSAGNIIYINNGTSETIRDGVVVNSENVKRVSDHVPKHLKPLNHEQLGYYLAGLIDGGGLFYDDDYLGLSITFQPNDASLAYYIKTQIGYGSVTKSSY